MKMRIPKWFTGGRRVPLVALLVLLFAVGVVLATHFAGFEVDGNIALDAGTQDWENALISTTTFPILANSSAPSAVDNPAQPGTAALLFDPLASGGLTDSTTFTGGSTAKETAPAIGGVTNWSIEPGQVPSNKVDLSLAYLWIDDAANNLALGLERLNENGDSHIDFSVDHLPWAQCPTDANSLCPVRTAGDLLIAFDIGGNGDFETRLFIWEVPNDNHDARAQEPYCDPDNSNPDPAVPNCPAGTDGCDGSITGTGNLAKSCVGGKTGADKFGWEEVPANLPDNQIEQFLNTATINAGAWGSFGAAGAPRTTIPAHGFFEAYVDLLHLGFTPRCPGTATVSVRTRSSESIDSSLMDLAGPLDLGKSSIDVTATLTPGNCALNIAYVGTASVPGDPDPIPILDPDAVFHWDFYKCNVVNNVLDCDDDNPPGDDTLVGSVVDNADSTGEPPFDVSASGAGTYYAVLTVTQEETECEGSGVSAPVEVKAPLAAVNTSLVKQVIQCDYNCTFESNSLNTGTGVVITPSLSGGSGNYDLAWIFNPADASCPTDNVDTTIGETPAPCVVDIADSVHCTAMSVILRLSDHNNDGCGHADINLGFARKQTIIKLAPAPFLTNDNVLCQDVVSGACVPNP